MNHLGSSEFCIFGNQSFLYKNNTNENSTNLTSHNPTGFAMVVIPTLDLAITPSDGFRGVVNNVTHVKVEMSGKELGPSGLLIIYVRKMFHTFICHFLHNLCSLFFCWDFQHCKSVDLCCSLK